MREELCYRLSKRLVRPPAERTVDYGAYDAWRDESLSGSWSDFSDDLVNGADVLDFGCGDGQLAVFLARTCRPRSVTGVDLVPESISRATANAAAAEGLNCDVRFEVGTVEGLPFADASFDTLVAFDCLEHVMAPEPILADWFRVLRPGGCALLEWYPFDGPWGPHMESLIPIPWAHLLFGERAMFRAAERIYDDPDFVPRHWDLDADGNKKPNKWRQWSSFREQAYVNELSMADFRAMARRVGFEIQRLDQNSFTGSPLRRGVGRFGMSLPLVGKHFVSRTLIELRRPEAG